MAKPLTVDTRKLAAAIAYCSAKTTPAAVANLKLLNELQNISGRSAEQVGEAANCGRTHVLEVKAWVESEDYEKLTREGSFRRERLFTPDQETEFAQKLGKEFKTPVDVDRWLGKKVPRSTLIAWCDKYGFVVRKTGFVAKEALVPPQKAPTHSELPKVVQRERLSEDKKVDLTARQKVERERMGISLGTLRRLDRNGKTIREENPVLRIEAILLLGTTDETLTAIALRLGCSTSELRSWQAMYKEGGIERLCSISGKKTEGNPANGSDEEWPIPRARDMTKAEVKQAFACARANAHLFLYGARGVGKTTLARSIFPEAEYFDCESPGVQDLLRSPEPVLSKLQAPVIIFDEIGHLDNPYKVLNAALELPAGKCVLSISSALFAHENDGFIPENQSIFPVEVLPLLWEDRVQLLEEIEPRAPQREALSRSGLPEFFCKGLSKDQFHTWAREVFDQNLRGITGTTYSEFLRGLEFVTERSGFTIAPSDYLLGLGMPTDRVAVCVETLFKSQLIWNVPTLGDNAVSRTRIFCQDTGFVHLFAKVEDTRASDSMHSERLWRHLVLQHLRHALKGKRKICWWESDDGHSIDFVFEGAPGDWVAVQCDWTGNRHLSDFEAFRRTYPKGINLIVSPGTESSGRNASGLEYHICGPGMAASYFHDFAMSVSAFWGRVRQVASAA